MDYPYHENEKFRVHGSVKDVEFACTSPDGPCNVIEDVCGYFAETCIQPNLTRTGSLYKVRPWPSCRAPGRQKNSFLNCIATGTYKHNNHFIFHLCKNHQ